MTRAPRAARPARAGSPTQAASLTQAAFVAVLSLLVLSSNALADPPASGAVRDKVAVFESYTLLQVALAGLLDGINPCAMSVAVFLVSFMTHTGRERHEIFRAGMAYAGAVFLAYLGITLGLFETLLQLSWYRAINTVVSWSSAALAFTIGFLTLRDLRLYRATGSGKATLVRLPDSFQVRIHELARRRLGGARLISGAFVLGFGVSFFEFVCSGQTVFPTLALILKEPALPADALRWRAAGYLVLYNLAFIGPLLLVFLAAYTGIASQRLARWAKAHFELSKLLLGVLFLWFGLVLVLLSLKDLQAWR